MCMEMDRNGYLLLEFLNKRISVSRKQKVCHVLDADRISAHLLQDNCLIYEVVFVMYRACRVAHCSFNDAAVLLYCLDRCFHIADIVESIENTDYIDSVFDGLSAESLNHIICIVTVTKKVLAAQEHLEFSVGKSFAKCSKSLPRIFIKESHAGIESSSAPAFDRIITDRIKDLTCRKHILKLHSCGCLALMCIS